MFNPRLPVLCALTVCALFAQPREATSTRERIALGGMWRWQTASGAKTAPPTAGWGEFQVPAPWPREVQRDAWYQREIDVPASWSGRRIVLYAEYLNSYAAVFIDGARIGEMRYPAGEVDLTSASRPGSRHILSLYVVAMPLKAVMLSYNDTASAREVEGTVARRGLCGAVYLIGEPAGARIGDVRIETSTRRWQIGFDASLEALAPNARYVLRARILDGTRPVEEFASQPFGAGELAGGRIVITRHWRPAKLWDTITPGNQYRAELSLVEGGRLVDAALPVRFGFREFWIDGRDFYLNGSRIFLSAIPLDNAQLAPEMAGYEATRATLRRFKSFGINFVYTHNYGCEPGAHLSFTEILRAADDEGLLLSFSQPHFGHYDWTAPDADASNGYAKHAEFYVRAAGNHPAVVAYSTSHNSTGYGEDMNPDMIDGIQNPRDAWSLRNAGRALRAEAIIRRLDGSRIVYHHASGNLGALHAINFYGNWIPIQEMSDWFEHWATTGVKPVFTCEYSVPFLWDWSMYRGWYKGKREFGSAVAPWEFHVAEWDAQFLGARAYRVSEAEKANLRWEAEQMRQGRAWHRWDYPQNLNSQVFEERFAVIAQYLTANFRAFRTWGVSATSPWEYQSYWKKEDGKPTAAAEALYRNNMPLLAYIGGKPAAFTSQDHNFLPGETVEKQIIVINNSRRTAAGEAEWNFGREKFTLPTGEQKRIPIVWKLPADLAPGRHEIHARVRFDEGGTQEDTFAIDVLPAPAALRAIRDVALFDPKGETAKLLRSMGVGFHAVDAEARLAASDVLVLGKGALAPDTPAPDIRAVRDGLRVIVFEQTGEVLEKRFGFRIAEYGLRQVFDRVPGHPLTAGLSEAHLRNWRGAATTLPPRLSYERPPQFNFVPTVHWAGIAVPRVWRAGNRGSVASALIEKPAAGDFLPILDGGYALQYTPLAEYREGRGMVLFCQMDVTGRTESDPAAERLARNLLSYAAQWQPRPRRTVYFAGDPAGMKHLRAAGYTHVLPAEPGKAPVLAVGLDRAENVTFVRGEHIAAYFDAFGPDSPFAGISPADVQNRDPRQVPLVAGGAAIVGDGVLARTENAVYWQLAPWQFDYAGGKMNVKRTFRKLSYTTARLLGNLGAEARTPLLERICTPVRAGEQRWLEGLYLDQPEEWDDPYRFFRW